MKIRVMTAKVLGSLIKPLLREAEARGGAAGADGRRIHDLRHTAAVLWIAAGANPKEVAARTVHLTLVRPRSSRTDLGVS